MFLTLLFLHLVAVASLFSGMALELAMVMAVHRAHTVAEVRAAVLNEPLIGPLMGGGAALLVIMGVSMVYVGHIGWQPWVVVVAAVTLALMIAGPAINGARGNALAALAAQTPDGPVTPQLDAARKDRVWNYCVCMVVCELIAALYIMSNKPELVVAIAAVAIAAAVAIVPVLRIGRVRSEPEALVQTQ